MNDAPVSLRPIDEADLGHFEALLLAPEAVGPFQWFGWRDPGRHRRQWTENGLLAPEQSVLAIRCGDEFAGFVGWRQVGTMSASHYWNLGIVLRPEWRGRGIGTEAQCLLVDYLFAHSPVVRLEADTEATNYAEQRALEKCGFTREGVRRSVTFRDGEWRDGVLYSLLRTDPRPWGRP